MSTNIQFCPHFWECMYLPEPSSPAALLLPRGPSDGWLYPFELSCTRTRSWESGKPREQRAPRQSATASWLPVEARRLRPENRYKFYFNKHFFGWFHSSLPLLPCCLDKSHIFLALFADLASSEFDKFHIMILFLILGKKHDFEWVFEVCWALNYITPKRTIFPSNQNIELVPGRVLHVNANSPVTCFNAMCPNDLNYFVCHPSKAEPEPALFGQMAN